MGRKRRRVTKLKSSVPKSGKKQMFMIEKLRLARKTK